MGPAVIGEIFLLSFGVSMDAFAVAVCEGISSNKKSWKLCITVGLFFGVFQALMPLIGYYFTILLKDSIISFGHWLAFALLTVLGTKMFFESFKKERSKDTDNENGTKPRTFLHLLFMSVVTSIDALAVGVTLAIKNVNIWTSIAIMGGTTFIICALGAYLGSHITEKFGKWATVAGGVILILIGVKVLLTGYGIIDF